MDSYIDKKELSIDVISIKKYLEHFFNSNTIKLHEITGDNKQIVNVISDRKPKNTTFTWETLFLEDKFNLDKKSKKLIIVLKDFANYTNIKYLEFIQKLKILNTDILVINYLKYTPSVEEVDGYGKYIKKFITGAFKAPGAYFEAKSIFNEKIPSEVLERITMPMKHIGYDNYKSVGILGISTGAFITQTLLRMKAYFKKKNLVQLHYIIPVLFTKQAFSENIVTSKINVRIDTVKEDLFNFKYNYLCFSGLPYDLGQSLYTEGMFYFKEAKTCAFSIEDLSHSFQTVRMLSCSSKSIQFWQDFINNDQ